MRKECPCIRNINRIVRDFCLFYSMQFQTNFSTLQCRFLSLTLSLFFNSLFLSIYTFTISEKCHCHWISVSLFVSNRNNKKSVQSKKKKNNSNEKHTDCKKERQFFMTMNWSFQMVLVFSLAWDRIEIEKKKYERWKMSRKWKGTEKKIAETMSCVNTNIERKNTNSQCPKVNKNSDVKLYI